MDAPLNDDLEDLDPAPAPAPVTGAATEVDTTGEIEQIEEVPTRGRALRVMKKIAEKVYGACYVAGEFFADLFGLTTPRYAYVLHEYERRERERREQEMAAAGTVDDEGPHDGDGDAEA